VAHHLHPNLAHPNLADPSLAFQKRRPWRTA